MPTAATECHWRRNRPVVMNSVRQSGVMLRRPAALSVVLVALAVLLSGCFGSDWLGGLPGVGPGTVTLQGTVFDGNVEGRPVVGASVTAGGQSDITDGDGRYSLRGV